MKTQQLEQPQRKSRTRLHRALKSFLCFRSFLCFCVGSAIVGVPALTNQASGNEVSPTPLLFGQPLSPPVSSTVPRQIDYYAPSVSTVPVESTTSFYAQPIANQPVVGAERYLVLVRSADPLVLQQVRLLEPGAFTRFEGGQTVIQAGNFIDFANAQQRVNQLSLQGLAAQIVSSGPVGGPTLAAPFSSAPFSPAPVADPYSVGTTAIPIPVVAPAPVTGYFVVIPSSRDIQPVLSGQVVRLVGDASLVRNRDVPIGPHVSVGPFRERGLAERWNRYFRDFGLDARVFFGQ